MRVYTASLATETNTFAPIAKEVLYVDSAGPLPRDLRTLAFHKIERPKWPFDEPPFGQANV